MHCARDERVGDLLRRLGVAAGDGGVQDAELCERMELEAEPREPPVDEPVRGDHVGLRRWCVVHGEVVVVRLQLADERGCARAGEAADERAELCQCDTDRPRARSGKPADEVGRSCDLRSRGRGLGGRQLPRRRGTAHGFERLLLPGDGLRRRSRTRRTGEREHGNDDRRETPHEDHRRDGSHRSLGVSDRCEPLEAWPHGTRPVVRPRLTRVRRRIHRFGRVAAV